jgi:hypothetical protein
MSLKLAKPLPAGAEYIADLAEKLSPKHGFQPYLILGICYAESNFGMALKPHGPKGTGDFIARPATPERDAMLKKCPLPNAVRKEVPSIKSRNILTPTMAWVPTDTGWGIGLFQIDWEAHFPFISTGKAFDPEAGMDYALKLLASNRKSLAAKTGLTGHELDRAMIASYNAGAGRVAKFIAAKKDIDTCTFHPGYIDKICKKADELAGASGSWLTPA